MHHGENRIGTVSSVDSEKGMVSVVYEDRDGEVTDLLPYATFNNEYKMPQPGEKVVVLHLSNGGEMGIVLGTYWNENNAAGYQGIYHKEIAEGAYMDYAENTFTIAAQHIRLIASKDAENITIADLMNEIRKIKQVLNMD